MGLTCSNAYPARPWPANPGEKTSLMGSAVDSVAAYRRAWWTLRAAALVNGLAELLDFLIPLWAGPVLGASGTQVNLLVGTELTGLRVNPGLMSTQAFARPMGTVSTPDCPPAVAAPVPSGGGTSLEVGLWLAQLARR